MRDENSNIRHETETCAACGQRLDRRLGRPKHLVNVEKLCDAFRATGSVRAAARAAGIPPATAWDRLRELGLFGYVTHAKKKAG